MYKNALHRCNQIIELLLICGLGLRLPLKCSTVDAKSCWNLSYIFALVAVSICARGILPPFWACFKCNGPSYKQFFIHLLVVITIHIFLFTWNVFTSCFLITNVKQLIIGCLHFLIAILKHVTGSLLVLKLSTNNEKKTSYAICLNNLRLNFIKTVIIVVSL